MRTVCVDDLIGRAAIVEICPTVLTRDEPAAERSEGLTVTNTLQNKPGRPSDRSVGLTARLCTSLCAQSTWASNSRWVRTLLIRTFDRKTAYRETRRLRLH